MASNVALLVLVFAGLFTATVGYSDDCQGYFNSGGQYKASISCRYFEHCCGTCDNRYCCSSQFSKLSDHDQNLCFPTIYHYRVTGDNRELRVQQEQFHIMNTPEVRVETEVIIIIIVCSIIGVVVIIMLITCCCCPCCCIYKKCRKPRPVVATQMTTVVNTQSVQQQQQPVMPVGQFSGYQLVPTQPGYAAQPVPTGQYYGQPCAPGAPPQYQMAVSPGYPASQAAYDGGQAPYPMLAQPGVAHLPSDTSSQPAYNPANVQPTKPDY